jgi:hypothetical protein
MVRMLQLDREKPACTKCFRIIHFMETFDGTEVWSSLS